MKKRNLIVIVVVMVIGSLACNLTTMANPKRLTVEINSPEKGDKITQGGEVEVGVSAESERGLTRLYFSVNGEVVQIEEPGGLPQFHATNFVWTPELQGDVILSVVALDSVGESTEPVSIQLSVAEPIVVPVGTIP